MKESKSIKDNYKKNTVFLNLFNLVIFFSQTTRRLKLMV